MTRDSVGRARGCVPRPVEAVVGVAILAGTVSLMGSSACRDAPTAPEAGDAFQVGDLCAANWPAGALQNLATRRQGRGL